MKRAALAGLLLVAAWRVLVPAAPPLYDGIGLPVEPYHYVSPPPALASSNKAAKGGEDVVPVQAGTNGLKTVQTQDKQVIAFFSKGIIPAAGANSIRVTIQPVSDLPAPPPGATYVGNDYRILGMATPGDTPVALEGTAQVLLRVPPVQFTAIKVYFAGGWHDQQFTVQQDYVNVALTHFGDLASFMSLGAPAHQPPPTGPSLLSVIEVVLILGAIGAIAVAIVFRRVRR
jgi:hypothetical protein